MATPGPGQRPRSAHLGVRPTTEIVDTQGSSSSSRANGSLTNHEPEQHKAKHNIGEPDKRAVHQVLSGYQYRDSSDERDGRPGKDDKRASVHTDIVRRACDKAAYRSVYGTTRVRPFADTLALAPAEEILDSTDVGPDTDRRVT